MKLMRLARYVHLITQLHKSNQLKYQIQLSALNRRWPTHVKINSLAKLMPKRIWIFKLQLIRFGATCASIRVLWLCGFLSLAFKRKAPRLYMLQLLSLTNQHKQSNQTLRALFADRKNLWCKASGRCSASIFIRMNSVAHLLTRWLQRSEHTPQQQMSKRVQVEKRASDDGWTMLWYMDFKQKQTSRLTHAVWALRVKVTIESNTVIEIYWLSCDGITACSLRILYEFS